MASLPTASKELRRRPRKRKGQVPPFIKWCRAISLISILAGGMGLMQPQFFWISVVLVYSGFAVLAFDIYFEPEFTQVPKIIAKVIILGVVLLFSLKFVFVPAPFTVDATATTGEFSAGRSIGAIAWKPYFTELNLLTNNPTDGNYDDVDILLKPDYPIAAITQTSNLSDVSFQDQYSMDLRMALDTTVAPLVLFATDAGYKVHCGRIPPKNALKIVIALVAFKPGKTLAGPPPEPLNPLSNTFVARARVNNNEAMYWWGHKENEGIYDNRPSPKIIKVSGHFTAGNRRRTVNHEFTVLSAP